MAKAGLKTRLYLSNRHARSGGSLDPPAAHLPVYITRQIFPFWLSLM